MNTERSRYVVRGLCCLRAVVLLLSGCTYALAGNVSEQNGITLQSTRIIYSGKETKGIPFAVTNNTQTPYLMQSRVTTWPPPPSAESSLPPSPFIVLPPLVRLEPGETVTLRIRLIENTLPSDKESVFAFQLKAIPGQKDRGGYAGDQARITLALQNTLKLFYRPEGLPPYDAQSAAGALQFKRQGAQLIVTNPAVFYATFSTLSAGGKKVDGKALLKMVPPLGQQTYPLQDAESSGDIRWQLLNEYGTPTISVTQSPENKK
ncbi:fimbrial biogenesis chaperone [Morganella morganii]|uniref:fimbrial biogenesis chaperone n=1 Tax=Morganella morganii TaxID=582 RepID=UPI001BDB8DC5|nr:molecular chaperone [Morganella morganii]MBT0463140.1 molecular chaperone [Morganella morganii subsp. morganii]